MNELIICASVKMPDGYVVHGHRHDGAMQYAGRMPRYTSVNWNDVEQGFTTSTNRFVGREEGWLIHFPNGRYGKTEGLLFSEDLY